MRPFFLRRSQLLAGACLGFSLSSCVLGFDAEVPLFDEEADGAEDVSGRDDASDAVGDVNADAREDAGPDGSDPDDAADDTADILSDADVPDGPSDTVQEDADTLSDAADTVIDDADVLTDVSDALTDASDVPTDSVDAVDAASDADHADTDATGDVADVADAGDTADATPAPSVVVTAPEAGDFATGTVVDVEWTVGAADGIVLDLVQAGTCRSGADAVVLAEFASLGGAARSYAWTIPVATEVNDYRVRVTATRGGVSGFACSEEFSIVEPPGCDVLDCEERLRACVTGSGAPFCGECVIGYEDDAGTCVPVDCGTPPGPTPNSTRTDVGDTTFGGSATYTCNEGYRVPATGSPNYSVVCGADRAWSPVSTCQPVVCGALAAPANGSVLTAGGVEYNDVASYLCNDGYARTSGSFQRTCTADGTWSDSPAVCSPVNCGTPPTVSNGSRSFTTTTFNSSAIYQCDTGYSRSGLATITCQANGSWTTAPTCPDIDECSPGAVCTATGNRCSNLPGTWQCGCEPGFTGTTVTAANAVCTPVGSGGLALGSTCASDTECGANAWCSTVAGYQRCSPRPFGGTASALEFAYVPSGTFLQGTPGATDEERTTTATLTRSYFVARTEVTQRQWKQLSGGVNPSCFQTTTGMSCSTANSNDSGPVERVDWFSAVSYANALSTAEGLGSCYALTPASCADEVSDWADGSSDCTGVTFTGLSCEGYRLLTEAEWERAARGGTTSTYFWGEATDQETISLYAWYGNNAIQRSRSVGTKLPNAFGLYDMSGNVWEWAWDWTSEPGVGWVQYPVGSTTDYLGLSTGVLRTVRGGGWLFDETYLRSADRERDTPDYRLYGTGVRLGRTAPGCGAAASVPNATVSFPTTAAGSIATYTCAAGSTQRAGTVSTQECDGETWSWTGVPLICDQVSCGSLSNPTNGSVSTPTGTEFGDVATFTCNSGYRISGSATLTCGLSGNWGTRPTCVDINECTAGPGCTAAGNACANFGGGWQCSCITGFTGTPVLGGDATCIPEGTGVALGDPCTSDSQCPASSWCSTVADLRRCAPRVFGGTSQQMDFVFVPSGTFQQGTAGAIDHERPYQATITRNYFMARTEVTQAQWKVATGGVNPSCFQSTAGSTCAFSNSNDAGPVENVDMYSALAYANWLSSREGLDPCYSLSPASCADTVSDWADGDTDCVGMTFDGLDCNGYRLPTESEWERAGRSGSTTIHYWGNALDTLTVSLYSWFQGNSSNRTQSVAQLLPNAYGLYDMSGNVWEWCWDWVKNGATWLEYPFGTVADYLGPASGTDRVLRGGSFVFDAATVTPSVRGHYNPSFWVNGVGFRLVRKASGCGASATVTNATALLTGTTSGSSATFSCASGYQVRAGTVTTQTCDGAAWSWTGTPLVCDPVSCGALTSPANGSVSTAGGTEFNDVASFSCNSGFLLQGSATLTCGANGSWGTLPTCSDINECGTGTRCNALGNTCSNIPGSWQCVCAAGFVGTTVTGGNATCISPPSGPLGAECTTDSECPSNSWCSTVADYRRCSPSLFRGTAEQMDFVFVPAGTFEQGRPGATDSRRPFTATLTRNYFVSRTEVSQAQWKLATGGTNPAYFQTTSCINGNCLSNEDANSTGPVERISFFAALAYANWLSVSHGLDTCYALTPIDCASTISSWAGGAPPCTAATFSGLSCNGYRLLTESEWERAARALTTGTYFWGEATDVSVVGLYAWFSVNASQRPRPVGTRQANPFGLFDMNANVYDMVWDRFGTYPVGSATDYLGAASGTNRSIRGGSFNFGTDSLGSADRNQWVGDRSLAIGIRLGRTVE